MVSIAVHAVPTKNAATSVLAIRAVLVVLVVPAASTGPVRRGARMLRRWSARLRGSAPEMECGMAITFASLGALGVALVLRAGASILLLRAGSAVW